jgi:hypothetical protein
MRRCLADFLLDPFVDLMFFAALLAWLYSR